MLTETERRTRYARQCGADPDTWTGTGPQRRRIARKNGHQAQSGSRRAAAYARRHATAEAAAQARADELLGLRFPLRPSAARQVAARLAIRRHPAVT
jgi:hypothetical protein